jgi:hypothetical protein
LPNPWTATDAGLTQGRKRRDHHAATGRTRAALRTADADRLAGDDARDGVALIDRVRVHEPGHGLLVGADIGRRDVLLRADDRANFAGVPAGHPLELGLAVEPGVDRDATLCAAVRNADQRALPRHPHREGPHLIDVGRRVIADAALCRTTREVVLDPIAAQHLDVAVVAAQRNAHGHLTARCREQLMHAVVEIELLHRLGKLCARGLPCRLASSH